MTQYKVKALVEVEYVAEYTGKMTSALKEAESTIIEALSKLGYLPSCELKKSKNSVGRLLKGGRENGILERSYRKPRQ